ncbi:MAG: magnesium transporter [Candidatus Colwellbacteria bacterium]
MRKTPIETIHEISFHPGKRLKLFREIPLKDKREVILQLSPRVQKSIIVRLNNKELVELLEFLDPDEATSIIRPLSKRKQASVIEELTEEIRNQVSLLLKSDPNTAAGLMSLDYIQVGGNDSVTEVIKQLKVHEKRTGRLPLIIVMEGSRVSGHIPGHVLGFADPDDKAKKYAHAIQTIKASAEHRDVINLFREHPHDRLIVLGNGGNVLGVIYSDDVLRILRDRESITLYEFAGVSNQEQILDPAWVKVRFRYKWLIINLATSFLAAFTVGLFDETISKYVLLAVYMPIIAGMGGNAATQTLAVLVRGISLGQVKLSNAWGALRNEILSGLINGLINGLLVGGVILLLGQDPRLALVLAIAMVANMVIAAFFGTLIPLIMQKLGKDPASSATIFITTATDVLGFLVFLGLASAVLL